MRAYLGRLLAPFVPFLFVLAWGQTPPPAATPPAQASTPTTSIVLKEQPATQTVDWTPEGYYVDVANYPLARFVSAVLLSPKAHGISSEVLVLEPLAGGPVTLPRSTLLPQNLLKDLNDLYNATYLNLFPSGPQGVGGLFLVENKDETSPPTGGVHITHGNQGYTLAITDATAADLANAFGNHLLDKFPIPPGYPKDKKYDVDKSKFSAIHIVNFSDTKPTVTELLQDLVERILTTSATKGPSNQTVAVWPMTFTHQDLNPLDSISNGTAASSASPSSSNVKPASNNTDTPQATTGSTSSGTTGSTSGKGGSAGTTGSASTGGSAGGTGGTAGSGGAGGDPPAGGASTTTGGKSGTAGTAGSSTTNTPAAPSATPAANPTQTREDMIQQLVLKQFPNSNLNIYRDAGGTIYLEGDQNDVNAAEAIIAQWVDIPYPSVKLDTWAIQVNTKSTHPEGQMAAQQEMVTIRAGVQMGRDMTFVIQRAIQDYINWLGRRKGPLDPNDANQLKCAYRADNLGINSLAALMTIAGFDINPVRTLAPADEFTFLSFYVGQKDADDDYVKALSAEGQVTPDEDSFLGTCHFNGPLEQLERYVALRIYRFKKIVGAQISAMPRKNRAQAEVQRELAGLLTVMGGSSIKCPDSIVKLVANDPSTVNIAAVDPLPHLEAGYESISPEVLHQMIAEFFKYWAISTTMTNSSSGLTNLLTSDPTSPYPGSLPTILINQLGIKPDKKGVAVLDPGEYNAVLASENVPVKLSYASSAVDRELKAASDQLRDDIQDLTSTPLLEWIRDTVSCNNIGGSGLDMVGNNTISVTSRQQAQVSMEADTYFPFQPRAKITPDFLAKSNDLMTGKVGSSDVGGGVLKLLGPMTPLLSLGLEAALSEPDEIYSHIGPGISVSVLPSVFRDSTAARLQMELISGIDADANTTYNPSTFNSMTAPPLDVIRKVHLKTDVAVNAYDLFELSTVANELSGPGEPTFKIPILDMLPIIGPLFIGPPKHETKHQESLIIVDVTIVPRSLDLAGKYY